MKNPLTLLCLCFAWVNLSAQNTSHQFSLEEGPIRQEIQFENSETTLRLCGLKKDETYQVWAIQSEGKRPMTGLPGHSALSPSFTFTPDAECADIRFAKGGGEQSGPFHFSASCISCENENLAANHLANLAVGGGLPIEDMIEHVFLESPCFVIENVQPIGPDAGRGLFYSGSASIGLEHGILLESGSIYNAPGPNNSGATGDNIGGGSDPDLSQIATASVFDAVGIEFDFIPTIEAIQFEYVFASEEYCEYVNSQFNDVFGFFISGPGFNGPFLNGGINIANLPGGGPVSINNVNHLVNSNYFLPNSQTCGGFFNANDIQFDGFTTVLTAVANLIPGEVYHIRLVVGDTGDGIFDSAVFLKANSFDIGEPLEPELLSIPTICPPDSLSPCQKACGYSTVVYEVENIPDDEVVTWEVTGAEDFTPNGSSVEVTWGATGTGEVTAIFEGEESELPAQIFCGQQNISPDPGGNVGTGYVFVNGATVTPFPIQIVGPNGFSMTYPDGVNGMNFFPLPDEGTYTVTALDLSTNPPSVLGSTCNFEMMDNWQDCPFSITPTNIDHEDGTVQMTGYMGAPPYIFTWIYEGGALFETDDFFVTDLECGNYEVLATDLAGCVAQISLELGCASDSSCYLPATECVEIITVPKAYFSSVPEMTAAQALEICQGQSVFFYNQSINATGYVWHFGDSGTSAEAEPTHIYMEAGNYEAMLIARSDCFCADTSFFTVNVQPADLPEIECVGSVCVGDAVDYSTPAVCGTYLWEISPNGTIIGGGGPTDNFVTVEWETGPEGFVSLQTVGCAAATECEAANVMPVTIMSDNAEIEGAEVVCDGDRAVYSIPDFLGANVVWAVGPAGTIEERQGTHRIRVLWDLSGGGDPAQLVTVFYENCFLGCEGQDSLLVKIWNEFAVEGDIQFCQNSSGNFEARNVETGAPAYCTWELLDDGDSPVWSNGNSWNLTVPFAFAAGRYTLRATKAPGGSICNETFELPIFIFENPPPPGAILGETQICPGDPQTYTAVGTGGTSFEWVINDGGSLHEMSGPSVNVVWGNAAPRTLSVVQISADGLLCTSEPTTLSVEEVPDVSISGESGMCVETTAFFSATDFEQLDYQWSITPANAGTILNGQGTPYIEVQWNAPGGASVELAVCNMDKSFPVEIWAKPDPQVADGKVCPGEQITVSTSEPFSFYLWKNEDGLPLSGAPSPGLGTGHFQVEVTDANGCVNATTFAIGEHPAPEFNLSAPIYLGLCPTGPAATIQATTQTGGLTYEWSGPSGPLSNTADHYSTNVPGIYTVTATNAEGCSTTKNYGLMDCESVGGECVFGICLAPVCNNQCNSLGNIAFDISPTADCLTHEYINQSTNYVPGSMLWWFHDGTVIQTDGNPTFSYDAPGYYPFLLEGLLVEIDGSTCPRGELGQDSILALAKFESTSACPGEPVIFTDLTEYLPSANLTAFEWDFGDPASGAANTSTEQHPSHIFAAPGTYLTTLTVTVNGNCQTSVTQEVTVYSPPQPHFDPPPTGCEGTALSFTPDGTGSPVSFVWDFGDPASGAANAATAQNAFHEYTDAGGFVVTLTTTNIYGCSADYFDLVIIQPNNLTGEITLSQPSPICPEEAVTLIASANQPADFVWSNGSVSTNINTSTAGIYGVTMTDSDGCVFSPEPAVIDVFGSPNAIAQAVVLNEYGQPVFYAQGTHEVCEGENVNLEMVGQNGYTYQWSTGSADSSLVFSEEKENLLDEGTYNFTVTVTDGETGCTSTTGIQVVVHPTPEAQILSDPSGVLCENMSASLFVVSPQAGTQYAWVTGELGHDITVVGGGDYFVTAISPEGCSAQSNLIEVRNAPGVHTVPVGCLSRCAPAEICLPELPDVVAYQWYLDGAPLPAPNGISPQPELTESGDYQVVMTDAFGCTGESGILALDLFPGYGTITGEVFFDVNGNGIVDAPDTTVSGVGLQLFAGGTLVENTASNFAGQFAFANVLSTEYVIEIDLTGLPPGWSAISASQNAELSGCDDAAETTWLLFQACLPTTGEVALDACPGENAEYAGTPVPAGSSEVFILENTDGCDSTVTVTVGILPQENYEVTGTTCQGSFFAYNGEQIPPGHSAIFIETNSSGCADTTLVTVEMLLPTTGEVSLEACPGESALYAGTPVPAGSSEVFILENTNGCDSLVQVNVAPLPTEFSEVVGEACAGEFFEYNGTQIIPGEAVIFLETNAHGCLDTVEVTAIELPHTSAELALEACPGESALYAGTPVEAGTSEVFILENAAGCDSLLTVSVHPFPTQYEEVIGEACEGEFFEYMGTQIAPGETVVFTETNTFGCVDSTVVTVENLVTSEDTLVIFTCLGDSVFFGPAAIPAGDTATVTFTSFEGCDSVFVIVAYPVPPEYVVVNGAACAGSFFEYNGTQIPAGETAVFTEINALGCVDSTVVEVAILAPSEGNEQFSACPGESVEYAGTPVPAGSSEVFILENMAGCDSVVTVTVEALETHASEVFLEACAGESAEYAGVEIMAGASQTFTLENAVGCDSVVTVFVESLAAAEFEYTVESACAGGENGSVAVTSSGGEPPHLYALDGQPFQSEAIFENVSAGGHTLTVLGANGCESETTVEVPAIPAMEVMATDGTLPCSGDLVLSVEVSSPLPVEFLWENEAGAQIIATPELVVSAPGTYFYTLENACEKVAGSVEVFPAIGKEALIYMPNSFSPNDNGVNDCYRGYTAPDLELLEYRLLIFDRKGDLVFETHQIDGCWDGSLDGQPMNAGVFAFFIEAKVRDCTGEVVEIFVEDGVHLMR